MTPQIALKLAVIAALPAVFSVVFHILTEKTGFGKIKPIVRQIIIGLIFGALSVCGTEFGVPYTNGHISAIINVRDAAPICAGLFFGPWAGIISGVIGGGERALCVLWGGGTYSVVACSVSTALAGLLAASARKTLFDDDRPSTLFATLTAVTLEVIHMTIMLLTHLGDATGAMDVIELCTLPMVLANGVSVMTASLIIHFLSRAGGKKKKKAPRIIETIESRLLVTIVITYLLTNTFVFQLQTSYTKQNVADLLSVNSDDIAEDIDLSAEDRFEETAGSIRTAIIENSNTDLTELCTSKKVNEISIVNSAGLVTESSVNAYIGFDLYSDDNSKVFLDLLKSGTDDYLMQDYTPAFNGGTELIRIGLKYNHGFIIVGIDSDLYSDVVFEIIDEAARARHVSETGQAFIILKSTGTVYSGDKSFNTAALTDAIKGRTSDNNPDGITAVADELNLMTIDGTDYYFSYSDSDTGFWIITVIPESEAMYTRDAMIYINSFMQVIVYACLFVLIFRIVRGRIVRKIYAVNNDLSKIIAGDLDVRLKVGGSREMISLSDDINSTVSSLKDAIAETAKKMDDELKYAKKIQHSALPCVFPERQDFELFASMDTAKDVGGDFYDFYMLDDDCVAILIADVSGKGIPAAMFMMTAKTVLRSLCETGAPVEEVMRLANEKLCENNEAGLFVTAWMGMLNLKTGELRFANAGHNPPVLGRADGNFTYLRTRPGLVLAGMEGVRYRAETVMLSKGDRLFLYTDGVTEATSGSLELYGEDRLIGFLSSHGAETAEDIIRGVRSSIDEFVGDAEQFDDITMLALRYNGRE